MEILLVILLSYLLKGVHGLAGASAAQKTRAALVVVALFAVGRVVWAVHGFAESLYAPEAGLSRSLSCEEIKALYQQAQDARDPDSFSDEVPFQANFEVLSSPLTRARYEFYGRTEDDAALKDLFLCLPFYVGALLLAYGLTCSKETIYAGKWGTVVIAALGGIEWQQKSTLPKQAEYSALPFTVHEQLEMLKALYYPLLLLLVLHSQTRFQVHQLLKGESASTLRSELKRNKAVLRDLAAAKGIATEELQRAVELNKARAQELQAELQQQAPSRWRKWALNIVVFGLILYSLRSKEPPQPEPNRPQYWRP